MKTEFENKIRRLSFLCRLMDIKIAWINPWYEMLTVILFKDLLINEVLFCTEI